MLDNKEIAANKLTRWAKRMQVKIKTKEEIRKSRT
jgi:hypothetical protein